MSRRRPIWSSTACSRCIVPSGNVPEDDVVGCVAKLHRGGEGAEPDCVFQSRLRVLSAKSKDLIVISIFLLVFDVNYTSIRDYD
jgi:hypothetical protein